MPEAAGGRRVRSRPLDIVRPEDLQQKDFAAHARFRYALRRFRRFSDARAQEAGLTFGQYELLLALAGSHRGWLTVGEIARELLVRPHSAVGLVNRAGRDGLLQKEQDHSDLRRVRVEMTVLGRHRLGVVMVANRSELMRLWRVIPSPVPGARRTQRVGPAAREGSGA